MTPAPDVPATAMAVPPHEAATMQALAKALHRYEERTALIAFQPQGCDPWSFRALATFSDRVAGRLISDGVGAGDRAMFFAPNRPEWIAAAFGVLRAGGIVVPVDVQLDGQSVAHIVRDSAPKVVFTTARDTPRLAGEAAAAGITVHLLDRPGHATGSVGPSAMPLVSPEDAAVLFYTSGTTGAPKGVPLSHCNLLNQVTALRAARLVVDDDRILLPLPLHHVYPLVVGVICPLALGLAVILPRALTGPQIVEAAREGEATFLIGVPRLYNVLVSGIQAQVASRGRFAQASFTALLRLSRALGAIGMPAGRRLFASLHGRIGPRLRVLVSGGAALNPETAVMLEALGWRVASGYGLTETTAFLTINPPGSGRLDGPGWAAPGVQLRIRPCTDESDTGEEAVAKDGFGEVEAKGPSVFQGYRNLPEQTRAAFTDDGWFRTGDLGRLEADGFLRLAGRASTLMVMEGGENVQPDDVEDAYQAHPLIREIAVLQRQGRMAAIIVPETRALADPSPEAARQAVQRAIVEVSGRLASYQRVTDFVLSGESLPRTRLGKPRRHLLSGLYERLLRGDAAASPEAQRPVTIDEMVAEDRALLENEAATAVWQILAQRYADRRLTPDSLLALDLGIDSLAWLDLSLQIAGTCGVELDESAIARMNSVRDLLIEVVSQPVTVNRADRDRLLSDPEAALREQDRQWLAPLSKSELWLSYGLYRLNRLLMRQLFRLEVVGLERLPADGPCLIAPSHTSFLDPTAIGAALPFDVLLHTNFAGWTGIVFKTRLRRWLARLARTIPVDPDRAVATSLALAGAVLKRGDHLVWFPEGERSRTGRLLPFRPGVGLLLEHYPVPVVPVLIQGAHEAWPRERKWFRLHPVRVTLFDPITPDAAARLGSGNSRRERITEGLYRHFLGLAGDAAPELLPDAGVPSAVQSTDFPAPSSHPRAS